MHSNRPDVVYVVRPGEVNEELRFSLRSLRNLPHGRVWIAGHKPRWVSDEVGHIPGPRALRGRASAKANLRAACEHPEVAAEFVYMCDDFFVMQRMERLPVMHLGPLSEVIRSRRMSSAYNRALEQVADILAAHGIAEPLMYDLHAPMLVDKHRMLEVLALLPSPFLQELTLYGNLNHLGGELRHNHKVRHRDAGWQSWPFLSTNDVGFTSLPVGQFIRSRFPDQSPYEATPPAPLPVPRAPRRPVRYRALLRQAMEGAA